MKKLLLGLVFFTFFLSACTLSTPKDTSPKETKGKLQLHEGRYFDDKVYGQRLSDTFYEIHISNISETSFDFTIYEVVTETREKEIIFETNTANFIEDGTKAAFYGEDQTLNFTFPDNHESHPVVTDIVVTGFEPLEGNTYVNNGIPGHEFGKLELPHKNYLVVNK